MDRDTLFDIGVGFVIGAVALALLMLIGWLTTLDNPRVDDDGQMIESEQ